MLKQKAKRHHNITFLVRFNNFPLAQYLISP